MLHTARLPLGNAAGRSVVPNETVKMEVLPAAEERSIDATRQREALLHGSLCTNMGVCSRGGRSPLWIVGSQCLLFQDPLRSTKGFCDMAHLVSVIKLGGLPQDARGVLDW
jgi:hypothetical protein